MEIHFVSGKGGVGKSAVAAALALRHANSGRSTLLVELGDQSFYQDYFDRPVVYQPTEIRPNLSLAIWSGTNCLREYAKHLLKVDSLYRLFFENSVSQALINIAPGLAELAIMGKITSGPPRNVGPKLDFDVLVVDAFSTGHFMALIKAPQAMAQTIRFGPMGEQSRSIDRVLRDPKICKYYIVSLPEELPTTEACELYDQISAQLSLQPTHVQNRYLPIEENMLKAKAAEELAAFQTYLQRSQIRQQECLARLKKQNQQVIRLPMIFETRAWPLIETLSAEWASS